MGPNSGLHIIILDELDAICKVFSSFIALFSAEGNGKRKNNDGDN